MTFPKNAATTWTRPPGRPSQQETLTGRRGRASEAKLGRRRGAPWGVSGKGRWREGLGRLRNGGWRGRKSNNRWCRGGAEGKRSVLAPPAFHERRGPRHSDRRGGSGSRPPRRARPWRRVLSSHGLIDYPCLPRRRAGVGPDGDGR